jgi:hypothetical protein
MPLAFLDGASADAEVVRLAFDLERLSAAEPLVSCVVVGQGVPDLGDGHGIHAFDDEGRVRLTTFDRVVHVDSLWLGVSRKAPSRSRRRSADRRCRLIHSAAGVSASDASW